MISVLIVEDSPGDRLLLRELLEIDSDKSVAIAEAASITEALTWIDDHTTPDVVMLDLGLPDSHGTDAISVLLDRYPALAIVVMTGHEEREIAQQALLAGAQEFITKGSAVTPDSLRRALRHAMDRAAALSALKISRAELKAFARTAAHDLKTPITAVVGMLTLAQLEGMSSEQRGATLDAAHSAATKLLRQVDELLSYAEDTTESISEVNVDRETEWAIELLDEQIKTTQAHVSVGDLGFVAATPSAVRSVILNLLSNALKYRSPDRRPHIEIDVTDTSGQMRQLIVRDNGIGVTPKVIEHAFDEGFQGSDRIPGTGVGLAAVRRMVVEHGGTVSISTNENGQGTTVTATWPAVELPED